MAENFDRISAAELAALARSPAGQQLMALLQQSGGPQLQQAAGKAAAGDLSGAKDLLTPLLADPRIQDLLAQLGGR